MASFCLWRKKNYSCKKWKCFLGLRIWNQTNRLACSVCWLKTCMRRDIECILYVDIGSFFRCGFHDFCLAWCERKWTEGVEMPVNMRFTCDMRYHRHVDKSLCGFSHKWNPVYRLKSAMNHTTREKSEYNERMDWKSHFTIRKPDALLISLHSKNDWWLFIIFRLCTLKTISFKQIRFNNNWKQTKFPNHSGYINQLKADDFASLTQNA